jgi:uncharacterized phage-like protein YoqJ
MRGQTFHVTGHRPPALGGYQVNSEENKWLIDMGRQMLLFLHAVGFKRMKTGMALGWDQWMLEEALKLRFFQTVAAIPCKGQERKWPAASRQQYHNLLKMCDEIHYVSDKPYDRNCMQERNMWMVDGSVATLAAFKGIAGGTDNCLMYARRRGNLIITVNSEIRKVDIQIGNEQFIFPG